MTRDNVGALWLPPVGLCCPITVLEGLAVYSNPSTTQRERPEEPGVFACLGGILMRE